MRSLHVAERIVVVLALGAVLLAVGVYLTTPRGPFGWFAYAPLAQRVGLYYADLPRDGLTPLGNLFVWLGLILGWCAGSLVALRVRLTRPPLEGETGS